MKLVPVQLQVSPHSFKPHALQNVEHVNMRVSESYEYNLRRMSAQLDSTDVCEDVLMAVHAYRT